MMNPFCRSGPRLSKPMIYFWGNPWQGPTIFDLPIPFRCPHITAVICQLSLSCNACKLPSNLRFRALEMSRLRELNYSVMDVYVYMTYIRIGIHIYIYISYICIYIYIQVSTHIHVNVYISISKPYETFTI